MKISSKKLLKNGDMPKQERLHHGQIDPNKLMDYLTEGSGETFQPNQVFSDSEKCAPIDKIKVTEKDGVRIYLRGLKYPLQQYPHRPYVKNACIIKKLVRTFLETLGNKKSMIKLLIFRREVKELLRKMLILFSYIIGSRRLKHKYYSHSVKEIYRVFNLMIEREDPGTMRKKWERIRDVICLILEFDNAYRSRVQDFLSELNIKKIKLTKEDLWFARQSNDYSFGGKRIKVKDGIK